MSRECIVVFVFYLVENGIRNTITALRLQFCQQHLFVMIICAVYALYTIKQLNGGVIIR